LPDVPKQIKPYGVRGIAEGGGVGFKNSPNDIKWRNEVRGKGGRENESTKGVERGNKKDGPKARENLTGLNKKKIK